MVDGVAGWITAVVLTGERATPKQSRLVDCRRISRQNRRVEDRQICAGSQAKTGFPISVPFLELPFFRFTV